MVGNVISEGCTSPRASSAYVPATFRERPALHFFVRERGHRVELRDGRAFDDAWTAAFAGQPAGGGGVERWAVHTLVARDGDGVAGVGLAAAPPRRPLALRRVHRRRSQARLRLSGVV
eukprot:2405591-Pleurochrysis_carterae.AAC.2